MADGENPNSGPFGSSRYDDLRHVDAAARAGQALAVHWGHQPWSDSWARLVAEKMLSAVEQSKSERGPSLEDVTVDALIDEVARLRKIERAARKVARRESQLTGYPLDLDLRMDCALLRTALDGEDEIENPRMG